MFIPMGIAVIIAGVALIRFMGSWIVGGITTAVGLCMAGVGIPLLSPAVAFVRGLL